MITSGMLSVFRFELRRTLTFSRIGVWLLLMLFPVFIISVVKYYEDKFEKTGLGQLHEPPIHLPGGVEIQPSFRDGQRVATIRFGTGAAATELQGVPIPRKITRDELGKQWPQFVDEYVFRPDSPSGDIRTREGIDDEKDIDDTVWGFILFGLLPQGVTLFGLLLWVTPLVQAEQEGRTWIYLAVRPRGRASVLFGKYLTAVTWTCLMGWTSATLCILIAQPDFAWRLWSTLILVVGFACLGYGALYSMIGVLVPRRAMVIAVGYTLVFEFLVTLVPAVINQFTVQYRLRNLFVLFMGWRDLIPGNAGKMLLGNQPAWLHILILCGYAIVLMLVAQQVIQRREYVSAEEI